jgi:hypothetical protein
MSTCLQLLRVAFWMLPFQRWSTVLGLALLAGLGGMLFTPSNLAVNLMTFGMFIAFAPPALLGGALWRALSAPRAISLAARGRLRLLAAAMGVAVTVAVLVVACYALFDLGMLPRWRNTLPGYGQMFVGTFAAATWWAVASFLASRSPLAMLLVLLGSIGCIRVFWLLGVVNPHVLWRQEWSVVLPLVLWALFGAWYLRARRIAPPGWLLPGKQSVLAAVASADTMTGGFTPSAALQRLLLGGATVPRILLQWLLAGMLWLGVLLVLARDDDQATVAAHIAFASLVLCPAIVAAQSLAIARRARSLWLHSGYSRAQLFGFTAGVLLRFAAGMAALFGGFLIALWYTQPWRPATTLLYALCAVFVTALLLAGNALARPRGWDALLRWPLLVLLCWLVAWLPLTRSALLPWGAKFDWRMMGVALFAVVVFHLLGRWRWQCGDLPRAEAS